MDVPGVAIAKMVKTHFNFYLYVIYFHISCLIIISQYGNFSLALPIINEAVDAARQSQKSTTNYIFVSIDRD